MIATSIKANGLFRVTNLILILLLVGVAWADSGPNHQVEQLRPIDLGTTGGNINDRSVIFCCGGTLGSLVEDSSGIQYILSNNHVIARTNQASLGEEIIQPGLIDQNPTCAQDAGDTVATLSDFANIKFRKGRGGPTNEVDAAIAQVVPGAVISDGFLLDIGPVSANTASAFIGQDVQKSGRTTGRTFGAVAATSVTVDVGYSNECGGQPTKVARYVNQIRITPGGFSDGGDSGSLVVESGAVDPASGLPRAVGLLFAGSSTSTIANPIGAVLGAFGVSMVGGTAGPVATGSVSGTVTDQAAVAIEGATVSVDTGQAATTAGDGTYTINDVPTGDRSITASATGFQSATQAATVNENTTTSNVDFALAVATDPTQSIAECIIYDTRGGRNQNNDLLITISVVDDFGNPVPGAEVRIDLFWFGLLFGTGSGATTNDAGEATYLAKNVPDGDYETTVTSIISSLAFEGSTPANLFSKGFDPTPDADCRGDAPQPSGGEAMGGVSKEALGNARVIKARNEARLFEIPGVVGTGLSATEDGRPVIEIYLEKENAQARGRIPETIENVPTRVLVTGTFVAY